MRCDESPALSLHTEKISAWINWNKVEEIKVIDGLYLYFMDQLLHTTIVK